MGGFVMNIVDESKFVKLVDVSLSDGSVIPVFVKNGGRIDDYVGVDEEVLLNLDLFFDVGKKVYDMDKF
jgi:hypothetical protein